MDVDAGPDPAPDQMMSDDEEKLLAPSVEVNNDRMNSCKGETN